jgi:uncharacterized protein (DUF2141 family)
MKKIAEFSILIFIFSIAVTQAQDSYSLSGTVGFQGVGDIIVNLCTQEEWESDRKPVFSFVAKLTEEQKKSGNVSFKIEGVAGERYGLIAFQDIDENGKLDRNSKGTPLEPFVTNRHSFLNLWSGVQFEVKQDITLPEIMLLNILE